MKSSLAEFAIFGGTPTFDAPLHVGRPNIPNKREILDKIEECLDRGWLTNDGPLVQEFESKIAEYIGVREVVVMCNATIGLEIVTRALGMSGEVIVPSFTFVATAHCLRWQGTSPIFCDIDPSTHNIDPWQVEKLIGPSTTGIVATHLWGNPCAVDELQSIANSHGIKLVFDAAHAFGASHKGTKIGNFGNAEVFSFHATKFLNSFEGGAVATNDSELADQVRLMRNFGFATYDSVIYPGTNGKMPEASAAMGLVSLSHIDELIASNKNNYQRYKNNLSDLPGIRVLPYDEAEMRNHQYVVLEIDESVSRISRDSVMNMLWAENVRARRYFYPGVHNMEPYKTEHPEYNSKLPETNILSGKVLTLPTGMTVTNEIIDEISALITRAMDEPDRFPR